MIQGNIHPLAQQYDQKQDQDGEIIPFGINTAQQIQGGIGKKHPATTMATISMRFTIR